ncbi:DUF6734 family protein [uncultured Aquimarina sp.]|uniref:DUF6734 family protein n=1 Tax=uncultured Aquimarina sp. TaxID=575652 RepID=UPI0026211782|nr:DUF6734 family protein [uncultured Aquimarina sp.]
MKIIHSFWSKPSLKKNEYNAFDRSNGGWSDRKYNYMSWALSCLQFKKYYKEVELVTDKFGYDILINHLNLPYTDVKVVLDDLNDYDPNLWALGKIYAYSIQDKPFIHVDGDVYIWEQFRDEIKKSPLIAQNLERDFIYYDEIYNELISNFEYFPSVLETSKRNNKGIVAINAGIIGGNNINFFKEFTEEAFRFVDKNLKHLNKVNIGVFNVIYEQFLFYAMAENKKSDIAYYSSSINQCFDGIADFTGVPEKVKYVHAISGLKASNYIGDLMAFHLRRDHPDYYYKIINKLKEYKI